MHVTTGAQMMDFKSGVKFMDPEALEARTAGLRCPIAAKDVAYSNRSLKYTSCGVTHTLSDSPTRVVTMNQGERVVDHFVTSIYISRPDIKNSV